MYTFEVMIELNFGDLLIYSFIHDMHDVGEGHCAFIHMLFFIIHRSNSPTISHLKIFLKSF